MKAIACLALAAAMMAVVGAIDYNMCLNFPDSYCLGIPEKCEETKTCEALATFHPYGLSPMFRYSTHPT